MIKELFVTFVGITFITAMNLTSPVFANPDAKTPHKKCNYSKNFCESNCLKGLNDKDKQAVLDLKKKFFESTDNLQKKLMDKKNALKEELSKKAPDRKTAYKLQEEISNINAQRGIEKIDFIFEVKKINPDMKCSGMIGKCPMGMENMMGKKGYAMGSGNMMGKKECPMMSGQNLPPKGCPAHKK